MKYTHKQSYFINLLGAIMKLHLSVNKSSMNGYLNLDPAPIDPNSQPAFTGSFTNLSALVEDSECTEILADDILDYIVAKNIHPSLEYWTKLLRHGGKLIVGGTDLYEVAKAIVNQSLKIREANELIHGTSIQHISQISMLDLCELIKSLGLNIIVKRTNGFKMVIEAVRN